MLPVLLSLLAIASSPEATGETRAEPVQALLNEESPDVFLAKATLQQYLERVQRQDWNGVRRLTHPKALAAIQSRAARGESSELAPWDDDDHLVRFALKDARSAAPGIVLIEVGERGESATYVLFKTHESWRIGAKEFGASLGEITDESVRARYPGWVDHQALTQGRRAERTARRPQGVSERHR
jgi:hypothetical protein